jgi:hypothetical protein
MLVLLELMGRLEEGDQVLVEQEQEDNQVIPALVLLVQPTLEVPLAVLEDTTVLLEHQEPLEELMVALGVILVVILVLDLMAVGVRVTLVEQALLDLLAQDLLDHLAQVEHLY